MLKSYRYFTSHSDGKTVKRVPSVPTLDGAGVVRTLESMSGTPGSDFPFWVRGTPEELAQEVQLRSEDVPHRFDLFSGVLSLREIKPPINLASYTLDCSPHDFIVKLLFQGRIRLALEGPDFFYQDFKVPPSNLSEWLQHSPHLLLVAPGRESYFEVQHLVSVIELALTPQAKAVLKLDLETLTFDQLSSLYALRSLEAVLLRAFHAASAFSISNPTKDNLNSIVSLALKKFEGGVIEPFNELDGSHLAYPITAAAKNTKRESVPAAGSGFFMMARNDVKLSSGFSLSTMMLNAFIDQDNLSEDGDVIMLDASRFPAGFFEGYQVFFIPSDSHDSDADYINLVLERLDPENYRVRLPSFLPAAIRRVPLPPADFDSLIRRVEKAARSFYSL